MRLDRFLRSYAPNIPYSWWQKHIRKGKVRVNGSRASCDFRLSVGQELRFFVPNVPQLNKNFSLKKDYEFLAKNIIYEDSQLIIINKPSGLAVQGGTKVFSSVDQKVKEYGLRLTHRLDKDTSGVLILAKDKIAARWITQLFRERQIKKAYIAWVHGVPKNQTIIQPIFKIHDKVIISPKGLFAHTEVFVINKDRGWVLLLPKTGRTHQLRVHMQYVQTPIKGDTRYSCNNITFQEIDYNRLFLHAFAVYIPNIGTIFAPLPDDFQCCDELVGQRIVQKVWDK